MRLRKWAKFVCSLLLLTCTGMDVAESSGKLNLQFLDYSSGGRTASGNACDPRNSETGLQDPCDPQFKVTADREIKGGERLLFYQQTDFYTNQDTVHFTSLFGASSNPLVVDLNYDDNKGHVWLEISVTDYDGEGTHGELMSQFAARLNANGTEVRSLQLRSDLGHTLSVRYWFSCNPSYHGDLCNKHCGHSNDNSRGHSWCDALGNKFCRFGWIDASTDCKKPHPCRTCVCANGGICVPQGDSGYRCQCQPGYHGVNCQSCSLEASQCRKDSQGASSCDLQPVMQPGVESVSRVGPESIAIALFAGMAFGGIGTAVLCCFCRRRSSGSGAY